MSNLFEPGTYVMLPAAPDWGLGQVQSVIGARVTVNFEDAGKQTIDGDKISLIYVGPDPTRHTIGVYQYNIATGAEKVPNSNISTINSSRIARMSTITRSWKDRCCS